MSQTTVYYAIFFDVDMPKDHYHAMHKRIDVRTFSNLNDGMEGKQVELKSQDGKVMNYKIISMETFRVENSLENNFFIVCNCKKIAKNN